MTTIQVKAGEPISVVIEDDGTLTWHHADVETKQECSDAIDTVTNPVKEWEPLEIEGTLACSKCGLEGAVYSGKWLRIFKREPGQTLGEGYAAWKRYCKEAEERIRAGEDEGKW